MVNLVTNINDPNYTGDGVDRSRWKMDADGVDRSRWKFDEHGFMLATNAALETARRQMVMAADDANREMIKQNNPSSATKSIDGVQDASYDSFKL